MSWNLFSKKLFYYTISFCLNHFKISLVPGLRQTHITVDDVTENHVTVFHYVIYLIDCYFLCADRRNICNSIYHNKYSQICKLINATYPKLTFSNNAIDDIHVIMWVSNTSDQKWKFSRKLLIFSTFR